MVASRAHVVMSVNTWWHESVCEYVVASREHVVMSLSTWCPPASTW